MRNKNLKKGRRRKRTLLLRLTPFLLGIMALAFLYLWQQVQIMRIGYTINRKEERKSELLKENRLLEKEARVLESPSRIESLARSELGMIRPKNWQIIRLEEISQE